MQAIGRGSVNPFYIDSATVGTDQTVRMEIHGLRVAIEGKLNADGQAINGAWTQFGTDTQPLQLSRKAKAAAAPVFDLPVEIRIAKPPTAVRSNGATRLFCEILVSNFTEDRIELKNVEIQIGEQTAELEGAALARQTLGYGVSIRPDKSGVVLMGLSLSADPPAVLRDRVRFTHAGRSVTMQARDVPVDRNPVRLSPPLRGSDWWAGNGPDSSLHHRGAILPMDGRFTIAQRFAFDFAKRVAGTSDFERGDLRKLESSPSYGAEVLAVADGTVSMVRDGIPDAPPYELAPPYAITKETLGGNLIVLDVGQQRWAVYGHLQRSSLRVKQGDRVRRGDVIAKVGNSASYSSHLHFHIVDGPEPFSSEGVPFVFDRFTHEGKVHQDEMPAGSWNIDFVDR